MTAVSEIIMKNTKLMPPYKNPRFSRKIPRNPVESKKPRFSKKTLRC